MNIQKILASNVYKLRKNAGLSQEHLAEKCGLHRTYIGGIEQCRLNVGINNIQRIAEALGVGADKLFEDTNEIKHTPTKKITWNEAQELVEHALLDTNSQDLSTTDDDCDSKLAAQNSYDKSQAQQGEAHTHSQGKSTNTPLNTDPNTRYAFCVISQDSVKIEDLDVVDPNIAMQILSNLIYNQCKQEDLPYEFHRIQNELLDYISEHAKPRN